MATRTGLILAAAWALCAAGPAALAPQKPEKQCRVSFASGRQITADVVDTPLAREKGLMFRRSLPKGYGMLFVFPREMAMSFWMKNTWVSLDIVFIGKDKRVTRVHERVRPSTEDTPDAAVARVGGPAQYVLELPAGAARRYRLKAGQFVGFEAAVPER
jgi:hypothetical protein